MNEENAYEMSSWLQSIRLQYAVRLPPSLYRRRGRGGRNGRLQIQYVHSWPVGPIYSLLGRGAFRRWGKKNFFFFFRAGARSDCLSDSLSRTVSECPVRLCRQKSDSRTAVGHSRKAVGQSGKSDKNWTKVGKNWFLPFLFLTDFNLFP